MRHIASGGMSEVFLVSEMAYPDRMWAVKVSNVSNKLSRKLRDETKLLSELDHQNLPRIVDFFTSDQYFYLVMEYVDGVVLSDYFIAESQSLPTTKILDIAIQLCTIIHYLHKQEDPIIYRDLKPANIMIQHDGTIKLIDFGIARKFRQNQLSDTVRIGTVGFAAPEQFEKQQTDQRTDIFSLGAVMYYLFTGGKYVYVTQKQIQDLVKGLPKPLIHAVNQMVELEPDKRFQDIREAKIELLKANDRLKNKRKRQPSQVKRAFGIMVSILVMVIILFVIL